MNTPGDFQPGEDARRGAGKKGRSGRPSNDARQRCIKLLRTAQADASVRRILADDKHPHFGTVYKTVMAYAHGTPKQSLDITHDLPALRIVRDNAAVAAEMAERRGDA